MNLTITRSNLLNIIQMVYRTSLAKITMPILGGILFSATENSLTATSTDIDLTIQCNAPASVEEEGVICLPARQITDIARHLPETSIKIESIPDRGSIRIVYDDSEININGFPSDQFPNIPSVEGKLSFAVNKNIFKEMIRKTIFAVSEDRTRPLFTGVLFEVKDQKLKLVATDTHRLALAEIRLDSEISSQSTVVPGNTLNELNRIMRSDEENLEIIISENHIFFNMGDTLVTSRLVAGQFPSYAQIIPVDFTSRLNVDTKDIYQAVERAALLSQEGMPVIHFSLSREQCTIFLSTTSGWIKEKLRGVYNGEVLNVFFNARYLMESLRVISTDEVTIDYTGPLSAAVIRPLGKDNYLSLLLPARPRSEVNL